MKHCGRALHLCIILCAACVGLLACGGTECATDADCGDGNRCVTSGGVFYPVRVCVAEDGFDLPSSDAGGDMADAGDADRPTDGQTNDSCVGSTETCGSRCGTVTIVDSCGDEQVLECEGCGGLGACEGAPDAQMCICPDGYSFDEEQRDCVDVDECAKPDRCESESTVCVNLPGSYECQCDADLGDTMKGR